VLLAQDETDLLLFPPLRAGWALRGQPATVRLSGHNARRVIFGAMNLRTGHRLLLAQARQRSVEFQAFLEFVRSRYRGWSIALLLDSDPSHTAHASQRVAADLAIQLLWLPKRAPHLNPIDTLWGQAKDHISANRQFASLDQQVEHFLAFLNALSNHQALQTTGVLSPTFWLRDALSNNF
jgi:hypothetical protein